jgi:PrpF protein
VSTHTSRSVFSKPVAQQTRPLSWLQAQPGNVSARAAEAVDDDQVHLERNPFGCEAQERRSGCGLATYSCEGKLAGVHGAPNVLNFLDAAGAKTGELFPTGNPIDSIDRIEVSCVDLPSPL